MSLNIHARRKSGKVVFRFWTTERDNYTSDITLSEKEVKKQLLFNRIFDALEAHEHNDVLTIERAKKNGTSVRCECFPLDSGWKKELEHDDQESCLMTEHTKEMREKIPRFQEILQKIVDEKMFSID